MAKAIASFVCQECGASYARWMGKCEHCGAWNSLVEELRTVPGHKTSNKVAGSKPQALAAVESSKSPRIPSGLAEVDQVLGGGIVPGSAMLLSGDPGIGKSTLVLQVAARVSAKHKVLYASGEESAAQIKLRADRIGATGSALDVLSDTDIDGISNVIETSDYSLVIIDSIQTMATSALTGAAGSIGQITACAQMLQSLAKRRGIAIMIIGHVTKEGNIAGPKVLEHLVDVVLYLEGERYGAFKALRGIKNRFGSTSEVGIFEMSDKGLEPVENPSAALLAERRLSSGSVVLATMEGTRPLLVEVQALVTSTAFGYPKRAAVGFDLNRLNLLVAVLTKRTRLNLSSSDIYVNVVGGLRVSEPAADLAIILSIASAFKDAQVPPGLVAFGEVGLSGEIRSVGQAARRLAEAKRLGYKLAVGPAHGAVPGLKGVTTIAEATELLLAQVSKH